MWDSPARLTVYLRPGAAKIVGISIAIIAALFLIQQFGTGFVGSLFSPIVVIWLLFNAGESQQVYFVL